MTYHGVDHLKLLEGGLPLKTLARNLQDGIRKRDAEDPCQEETQGGSDDKRKREKRMMMGGETRYKVRYKRASTDLYRWGEPDRDVYVRKWQYVRKRECISYNPAQITLGSIELLATSVSIVMSKFLLAQFLGPQYAQVKMYILFIWRLGTV